MEKKNFSIGSQPIARTSRLKYDGKMNYRGNSRKKILRR
jgi:hypothetical protein